MVTNDSMTGEELGENVLESIRQMNAGLGTVVYSPIIAARQRVLVAGVNYDAERRQFEQGLRTMREVLESLADLGDAQLGEIRAIVDYQVGQIDLAFATGTLLGYSRVDLAPLDLPTAGDGQ